MKLKIYSDIHLGAPHSLKTDVLSKADDTNTFFLGDIFDLKNTKKGMVEYYKLQMERLKNKAGVRFIIGNHEIHKPESYFLKLGSILFTHGHILKYPPEKVKKYENMKAGRSNMSYFFYSLRHWVYGLRGVDYEPSKKLKEACFKACMDYGCDTIIFGHTHRRCDIKYKSIRIVNVPRGYSEVEV